MKVDRDSSGRYEIQRKEKYHWSIHEMFEDF
jgi:hypothetical protein